MALARRLFLKALRLAPAAPLAAKAAIDKSIADAVGITSNGIAGSTMSGINVAPLGIGGNSDQDWKQRLLRFLHNGVLPDWADDQIRFRCRQVTYLDADIAAKRSWSMSVKIATQRERNIEAAKKDVKDGPMRSLRSQEFAQNTGIWI